VVPGAQPWLTLQPKIENNVTLHWETEPALTIPEACMKALGPGTYVACVEEVHVRMPVSYSKEPITLADTLNRLSFCNSRPRFSARVPFHTVPKA
jgi:hypothetical protein